MTLSNWIELAVIIGTVIFMGVPLLRITKRVKDLEGADLVEVAESEQKPFYGTVINGK